MKLKPLNDFVIVKPDAPAVRENSLIYIPDMLKEKADTGTILGVGQGRVKPDGSREPIGLDEGDRVLFTKNTGQLVKVEGQEVLVLKIDNVYAKIQ